jgi:dipeptidyl aminopeptidase/acylaminoacyl peptidase
MRIQFFGALLFSLSMISCSTSEESVEFIPGQYTIEQFYKNKNVFGGSFSSDASKLLVSSNETGIYNAMALRVNGGRTIQLTNSGEESVFAISFFPNDDRILFRSDRGGDEITHIFMLEENGKVTDLTPDEKAKANFFGWAKDLKSFFYGSNARDENYIDLYEMNIEGFDAEMIYKNDEGLNVSAISDDKRYLALIKNITTNNSEMYLYDRETKIQSHISEHEGEAQFAPQYFSRDNLLLYYLTDVGSEFQHLRSMDIASGVSETVFETQWDVQYSYESYDGKYRVIGYNDDGKTHVKLFMPETGNELVFPSIQGRSISSVGISRDEHKMRLTAASSMTPSDIYVYDFASEEYRQLTNNLNPEISAADLVEATVVRYKSFDGTEIPAIYYIPHNASPENKVPGLIWVHGGPGGQSRQTYFALIQYMVNQGYAVLAVNNRGSSGYGKTFFKMDNKRHGEDDLQDCIYGKKYLQTLDYIDHDRIGIIGGSYGGYMTMAALTFAPEEFAVGVNIFGVTNWLRTLKSIPTWWESFRKALYAELGDPYSADSVRLRKISPLFHASNVTKPLMVLQGANDPRVLQVESDEIVAAVKANGVPVEYVLFEDEGHGFLKKENEIRAYGQIVTFLEKYLKGEGYVKE